MKNLASLPIEQLENFELFERFNNQKSEVETSVTDQPITRKEAKRRRQQERRRNRAIKYSSDGSFYATDDDDMPVNTDDLVLM